ncbi:hypothetical protein KIH39_01640 [Telmatocola sphagniphila]|uniref:Uncharacterized protein n=1 Tax=Telmatocola sphagniphila TaxID=1123043 RepID=A0A8E6B935_9BACT|nr:hypothetical protein [Telmatocola sphagniphila]QVL32645.1 hypothetical protein KIH39_01640 [Telmatocola sphagniphila]
MERMNRRQWLNLAGAQVGGLYFGSSLLAQQGGDFNERAIEPRIHREDKSDIWTLHFNFKDPRVITVDVPGRGTKVVWYLLYKVINRTNAGQKFYPDFELVTLDKHTVHSDEILPSVEDAIKRREDPTNRLDIKNSVTISKDDIPVTKADSFPRAVTGVAIWSDVYDRAKDTNRFSIFVTGLSNGWTMDDDKVIRRKTLQLNFQKLGDENQSDIRWVDNPEWRYRASAKAEKKEPEKKENDKK